MGNLKMGAYKIAVLPGDGIGPEVMKEALKVLKSVEGALPDLRLQFREYPTGERCYLEKGSDLPAETMKACKEWDAILFGSAGLPDVRYADGTEIAPQLNLRFTLDLYAGIRPIKKYPVIRPVLAGDPPIDYVIFRENTEGLYASRGGGVRVGSELAVDNMVITRKETERIVKYAFRLAQKRKGAPGDGKKRVTCVDKAKVLRSMAFFREVFGRVASSFPEIDAEHAYVDAMTLHMVQKPQWSDVVVMENMFGGILSDLAAGTIGGMGLELMATAIKEGVMALVDLARGNPAGAALHGKTAVAIFLMAGFNGTAFYPSTYDLNSSLTISKAASSLFTLKTMMDVSFIVPVVMAYIWYAWKAINNKRITDEEMNSEQHIY